MTHSDKDDPALKVLLETATELGIDLPAEFIRATFEVQRRHQFDKDSAGHTSLQELDTLANDLLKDKLR